MIKSSSLIFKTDIKSLTVIYHWEWQPYFLLANLFLKQGISSEYVTVDFIGMGLIDLWEASC